MVDVVCVVLISASVDVVVAVVVVAVAAGTRKRRRRWLRGEVVIVLLLLLLASLCLLKRRRRWLQVVRYAERSCPLLLMWLLLFALVPLLMLSMLFGTPSVDLVVVAVDVVRDAERKACARQVPTSCARRRTRG